MTGHLSGQEIGRYKQCQMRADELRALEKHLADCESCRAQVSADPMVPEMIAFLQADLSTATETDHLSYEQAASYIDDKLSDVDREIAQSHLEFCSRCRADIENLQEFKADLATYAEKDYAPAAPPTFWQRFITLTRMPEYAFAVKAAGLTAAAALIVIFFWFSTQSLRNQLGAQETELANLRAENEKLKAENRAARSSQPEIKTAPAPVQRTESKILVALNDGNGQVLLDELGNLTSPTRLSPDLELAVKKTLTSQRVELPQILATLIGRAGVLRSGTGAGISFPLLGPVGTVIKSDRPTFRWRALDGASGYRVTVYDTNFNQAASSELLTDTTWTVSQPLKRGGLYTWKVTAIKNGEEIISPLPPAPEAKFKLLDLTIADELKKVARSYQDAHLLTGILYAKAGLLDDAEQEFQSLLDANPQSPVARQLLRNLKALRLQR